MLPKLKVLFLCTANACRSQMAEGWARHLHGDRLEVFSAGVAPGGVDPRAMAVMGEAGVDLSAHASKHVDALLRDLDARGESFDWVVTVCDSARESCPVFPRRTRTIHRSFEDPPRLAAGAASEEEALGPYRQVRDRIRDFVAALPATLEEAAGSAGDSRS